ncbi:C40 family peptidase [Stenoxybacter acetivorans]|uniref:C40 family peptidase n=1 Tax=Stenoxybacter acetivorans TaxID=422441 RepID=UPI00055D1A02|nr:C40 family peptidase [Stenoxybacter acetivorans]
MNGIRKKISRSVLSVCIALSLMNYAQAAPEGLDNAALDRLIQERSEVLSGEDGSGDLLMNAMGLLGVAYRFGGNSPISGLDCSGFMQYIFKRSFKVNLPRTSREMAKEGEAVSKEELQPGDMVFFNTLGRGVSHVGMYIGKGRMIHAPRTGKDIEIVSIDSGYWAKKYVSARRVVHSTARFLP